MSSLQLLISSRKYSRGAVTRIYNTRENFPNLTCVERQSLSAKLQGLSKDLFEVDKEILRVKWETEDDDQMIDEEMLANEVYQDRIRESLCLISTGNSASS